MEGPERLDTVAFDLFRRFRQDGAEAGCPPGGAPSAVADDSLLRELQVWKSCLADAGDRLQQVTGSTEEEFLAVGARLHEFYSRAGDIERMTRGVAENVLGDEFGSDMKSLSAILDRIAAYLGQADSQTEQLTQTLRSVLELIDRVDTPLEGFRKIIKNLHMLSTAVSINSEIFEFVQANGCNLETFRDKSYHIGHSNSVLEHVGDWDNMVKFSSELCRVSERQFVQTPNYWFPIEPHCMIPFFHWLPKPVRIRLVMSFSLGHWSKARSVDQAVRIVESARLLNKLMFKELYHEANIITERFMMLPKSFIAINNSTNI